MKPVRGKRTANEYSRSASPLDEEKGSPPPYVHVSSYVITGLLGHIVFLRHRAGGGGERPCWEVELLGFKSQLCLTYSTNLCQLCKSSGPQLSHLQIGVNSIRLL